MHRFQCSDPVVLVLWLWASGTLNDDSCAVTWRSATACRCHWQRVATSAARQTFACVTGCVCLWKGSEWSRGLCYKAVWICLHFIYLYMFIVLVLSQLLCHVSVWVCSCDAQTFSTGVKACCVCHCVCDFDRPPPPRSCCHMLAASVSVEQRP